MGGPGPLVTPEANALLHSVFQRLFGRAPTMRERHAILAIWRFDGGYGEYKDKDGAPVLLRNLGGVQCPEKAVDGTCSGTNCVPIPTFELDAQGGRHDGTGCFRRYNTWDASAEDQLHNLTAPRRPLTGTALGRGSYRLLANAMHAEHYFTAHPEDYAQDLYAGAKLLAPMLGETLAVALGPLSDLDPAALVSLSHAGELAGGAAAVSVAASHPSGRDVLLGPRVTTAQARPATSTTDARRGQVLDALRLLIPARYGDATFERMTGGHWRPGPNTGTPCGFLVSRVLRDGGALAPTVLNLDAPELGIHYEDSRNISKLIGGARALGAFHGGPDGIQPGDPYFLSDGPPLTEHVGIYTGTDGGAWITGDAGRRAADGTEITQYVRRAREGNRLHVGGGETRAIVGYISLDRLPWKSGGGGLAVNGARTGRQVLVAAGAPSSATDEAIQFVEDARTAWRDLTARGADFLADVEVAPKWTHWQEFIAAWDRGDEDFQGSDDLERMPIESFEQAIESEVDGARERAAELDKRAAELAAGQPAGTDVPSVPHVTPAPLPGNAVGPLTQLGRGVLIAATTAPPPGDPLDIPWGKIGLSAAALTGLVIATRGR